MWEYVGKEILRPVLVNLLTAAAIFSAALVFKGSILKLFGLAEATGYPIVCSGEIYHPESDPGKVWLDIYVTNPTRDSFADRQEVQGRLNEGAYDDTLSYSPDVVLELSNDIFRFRTDDDTAERTDGFNRGKGAVDVLLSDDGGTATVSLEAIEKYSTLRATLEVERLESVVVLGNQRGTIGSLPVLDLDVAMSRCYTVT